MKKFDNTKPNIILLADYTSTVFLQRVLGVSKLACELRRAGYEVLVINHLHTFTLDEIKDLLRATISDRTVFVGVNSVFYMLTDGAETTEQGGLKYNPKQVGSFLPHGKKYNSEIRVLIKELNPNCAIVLGGPDAKDQQEYADYDYVVQGLADKSAINLANFLEGREPLQNARQSVFGFTVVKDIRAEGYNFVGTPMEFHDHDLVLNSEALPIEISRGCIFSCKFCAFPLNGKKKNDYIKHEDVLYAEFIDNYERHGATRYIFSDDTFNDSQEKIQMINSISKRLPFKLEYWAYTRLDLLTAHPETIDSLYSSGCRGSYFGIESLNRESAAAIGKGGSRTELIETVKRIKNKYGDSVALHGSFIFGLPKEDVASMQQTIDQLVSGATGLDSWFANSLRLTNVTGTAFSSEFDRNYQHYGYREVGFDKIDNTIVWENDLTDYYECKDLASRLHQESINSGSLKNKGIESFFMSSLGFDLAYSMNKTLRDFNWHSIVLKKQERVAEYKEILNFLITPENR